MPASLCSLAATIGVLMSMYGRNFSETRLTPPPTTNNSGLKYSSMRP